MLGTDSNFVSVFDMGNLNWKKTVSDITYKKQV